MEDSELTEEHDIKLGRKVNNSMLQTFIAEDNWVRVKSNL